MRRFWNTLGILFCACGLLAARASGGEVTGRIIVTKALTKKRVLVPDYQMRGMAVSSDAGPAKSNDEFSRIVVFVDDLPLSVHERLAATLTQKGIHFTPEILVVPVGSTVSFPNDDPIFHNVFSLSKAKQFDLGYYPAGQTRNVKFDKPGVVQVYCHIHRDMSAAILVVPNQWHVLPENDGTFVLSGVPAGARHITVWHKSAGFFRKRVEVPETGTVDVAFTIPVPSTE